MLEQAVCSQPENFQNIMHQPTSTPRPSLYYDYKVHAPWLPSKNGKQARQKVVIAGMGPSGMVAALELARHGIASILLNGELQVSAGSRAIVFTRRSLEILQQVGVAQRMTAGGLPWRNGNSYYRGQRVFRLEAPHDADDRFGPLLNVQQQYMEEYLLDACEASKLIELRWGNKVVKVENQPDHAVVTIDTPEGEYKLETDWLIDASGGRSEIRSAFNLKMEGSSYEGFFVIADIKIDLPLPTERLAFFDPEWNPGNTILMHREPHGIWRVDYQLPPGETPEEALKVESLTQRINAQLKMIGHGDKKWELDWSSVYSARTLTLPSYRHGRVLFTGDAAHLLPIFGVRGANTGFQDAQSLAWHLAYGLKGLGNIDKLIENSSVERVGAAREIIDEGGKSTRFMTPPSKGFRLLRDAVLSLSLTQEFVRPLYHWRTSRPHEYTHSALNSTGDDNSLFTSGPAHGAPPQNIRLGEDDYLLDHLGGGFELLYFTKESAIPAPLLAAVDEYRKKGVVIHITAVGASKVQGADQSFADADGHFRQRYGIAASGGAYLLRPDQHTCARWVTLDAVRLKAALQTALPQ
jgi:3-(3-hydroxy-phenyl)propionate hydroxylase